MQCVQCKGYELVPHELDKGLVVAQCKHCEGSLLALLNYRFWVQHNHVVPTLESVTENAIDPQPIEDQTAAKQCPKCSRLMLKFRLTNAVNNRLDFCASCDDVWLDKNEWQLFKQLQLPVELPQLLTDSWQRQLREQKRVQALKHKYVDLLGLDDFEKLSTFKQWLDQHPHKSEIKHFLTINN